MGIRLIKTGHIWLIKCRACKEHRIPFNLPHPKKWEFNGNFELPTITPSVNETINPPEHEHYQPERPTHNCHFVVTDGMINYDEHCTHELAGKALPLEEFSEAEIAYYKSIEEERAKE